MGITDRLASLAARLRSLLRGVRGRSTVDAEMREEFRHHIDLRTQDLIRHGLSAGEAARRAHVEFGHMEAYRDHGRAAKGLKLFDRLRLSWIDAKLGLRMLRKHPGLTLVSLFALGVAIPVGLAPSQLFRAVRAPLPVADGDRILAIRYFNVATSGPSTRGASLFELETWREELTSFDALAAFRTGSYSVTVGSSAGPDVSGAEVTAGAFGILGATPLMGRTLDEADQAAGASGVVLIGYDIWRVRFGGDPAIVGRQVAIEGVLRTVVGVMPRGFRFPHWQQLWLPLEQPPTSGPADGDPIWIFGRLADDVGETQAETQVVALGERMAAAFPDEREGLRAELVPFGLTLVPLPSRSFVTIPQLYGVQLAALLLLFVACTNVAMLMLARSATRSNELAVRTALGATRRRVLSQIFTETLALTLVATGLGLIAADRAYAFLFQQLVATPGGMAAPYWLDLGVTPAVVLPAITLAALSAVLAGVLPALKMTGPNVQQNIQSLAAGRTGVRFGGLTSALIVLDVALTVAVVGYGTLMSNRLLEPGRRADLVGIPAEEYLAVTVDLTEELADDQIRQRFALLQRSLVERLEAEPQVRSVAVASVLPRMEHPTLEIRLEADGAPGETLGRDVHIVRVTPGFFEALAQPILLGRGFDRSDLSADSAAVIVNTALVTRAFGRENPLGRRLRFVAEAEDPPSRWYEIVGVVGPLGANILAADGGEAVYLPGAPGEIRPFRLAIHLGAAPEAFTRRLREIVAEVDPVASIDEWRTPRALSWFRPIDWYLDLVVQAGLLALVLVLLSLAVSSLYAIMSFAVTERAREVGIRRALGARGERIALTVGKRALCQIGIGVMLATPGVVWLFFRLREHARLDLSDTALVGAALLPGLAVLVVVALFACLTPTLRALRIDPNEVLKG
jgi:putative ABC transport system permease protein